MKQEDEGEITTTGWIDQCRRLDTDDTRNAGVSVNRGEFEEFLIVLYKRLVVQHEEERIVVLGVLVN